MLWSLVRLSSWSLISPLIAEEPRGLVRRTRLMELTLGALFLSQMPSCEEEEGN